MVSMMRDRDPGPAYVKAAEELEGAVLRGDYAVGDRLPSEHALAKQHGVNRHTVRRSLAMLRGRGVVYSVKGSGSYVHPGRIDYRVAREMSYSDSIARTGLEPGKKILGVRAVRAHGRCADALDVSVGEPLVAFDRVRYAGQFPLVHAVKHLRESLFPGIRGLLPEASRSESELIRAHYGTKLIRVHSVFEIEPADQSASSHLSLPIGAALLRVENLDALEDGTPAQWGISRYRGDAVRIRAEIGEGMKELGPHDIEPQSGQTR